MHLRFCGRVCWLLSIVASLPPSAGKRIQIQNIVTNAAQKIWPSEGSGLDKLKDLTFRPGAKCLMGDDVRQLCIQDFNREKAETEIVKEDERCNTLRAAYDRAAAESRSNSLRLKLQKAGYDAAVATKRIKDMAISQLEDKLAVAESKLTGLRGNLKATCVFPCGPVYKTEVVDSRNGRGMTGVTITLLDGDGKTLHQETSNEKGFAMFPQHADGVKIIATKDGYIDADRDFKPLVQCKWQADGGKSYCMTRLALTKQFSLLEQHSDFASLAKAQADPTSDDASNYDTCAPCNGAVKVFTEVDNTVGDLSKTLRTLKTELNALVGDLDSKAKTVSDLEAQQAQLDHDLKGASDAWLPQEEVCKKASSDRKAATEAYIQKCEPTFQDRVCEVSLCSSSSNWCLQSRLVWRADDTCEKRKDYCDSRLWGADMLKCCPGLCASLGHDISTAPCKLQAQAPTPEPPKESTPAPTPEPTAPTPEPPKESTPEPTPEPTPSPITPASSPEPIPSPITPAPTPETTPSLIKPAASTAEPLPSTSRPVPSPEPSAEPEPSPEPTPSPPTPKPSPKPSLEPRPDTKPELASKPHSASPSPSGASHGSCPSHMTLAMTAFVASALSVSAISQQH